MNDEMLRLLCDKMKSSEGIRIYSKKPAKFEQWIQVELCGILSAMGQHPVPEMNTGEDWKSIDIVFDSKVPGYKEALEIKVLFRESPEWQYSDKGDNASKSMDSLEEDIRKLNSLSSGSKYEGKWILFVVVGPAKYVSLEKGGAVDWKTEIMNKRFREIQCKITNISECAFTSLNEEMNMVFRIILGRVN